MIENALFEAFKTTTDPGNVLPTATPTHVAPIPSVLPPTPHYEVVGHDGKVTLWVIFVLMVLSSAVFAGMSWTVPVSKRVYHVLTTLIVIVSSLSYFAMATGHGVTTKHIRIRHSHDHVPDTYDDIYRQVFWARHVDWALTTPLILLSLGLLAGLNGAYILMAIVADLIMTLTSLFAAFGTENTAQKWGWYAIAIISYLVIVWHLALNGRTFSAAKGPKVRSFYTAIASYTVIVWMIYPIIWAVAEGSRKLSVDGAIIAYAVLDLLAKPIFGIWLLVTYANLPESNIELGGFWTYGVSREGALRIGDDNEA